MSNKKKGVSRHKPPHKQTCQEHLATVNFSPVIVLKAGQVETNPGLCSSLKSGYPENLTVVFIIQFVLQ